MKFSYKDIISGRIYGGRKVIDIYPRKRSDRSPFIYVPLNSKSMIYYKHVNSEEVASELEVDFLDEEEKCCKASSFASWFRKSNKLNLKDGEVYLIGDPHPLSPKNLLNSSSTPPKGKGWLIKNYESKTMLDSSVGAIRILKKAAQEGLGKLAFHYHLKWPWGGEPCRHKDSSDGTRDRCLSCLGSDYEGGWIVQGRISILVLEIQKGTVPYNGLRGCIHFNRHVAPNDVLYDLKKNIAWRLSRVGSNGDASRIPFTWVIYARELLPGDLKEDNQFSKRIEKYEEKIKINLKQTGEQK